MRIGIPREVFQDERRVAGTPRTVKKLCQSGFEVWVERGAGDLAEHSDSAYAEGGAQIIDDVRRIWSESDIILKVRPPQKHPTLGQDEADLIRDGACLIGFIWPAQSRDLLEKLAAKRVTTIAMDCVPRITRAQKVDALSAMANAAGYRAVIEAANVYPRFLAGQVTAAGSIPPAKVLVIGAGVAGLAAIGAARGLGAIVRAFDTRPEAREQIRSMGAEAVELEFEEDAKGDGGYAKQMSDAFLEAERALFAHQAMEVDIIITTALIPGKEPPKLITPGMVESMREGSVIVDLAAPQGGNCSLTQPGKVITHKGVLIVGYIDLPSRMALQASWLYASVLVNMIDEMGGAESFRVDLENEVVRGALVTYAGEITWPPPKPTPPAPAAAKGPGELSAGAGSKQAESDVPAGSAHEQPWHEVLHKEEALVKSAVKGGWRTAVGLLAAAIAIVGIGLGAPESFLSHLTVFVLAVFVGWQVVWNVTPALHTPLMSVTNAISGIIVLGGMLHLSGSLGSAATILGFVAVLVASINIVGGFLVSRRMLAMFQR
ncbi:MAG: Re/Si-specific NAD(P)(+) transhydrogenase subunit alpha [Phycisphaerales bacterium]|nr:Re/Si-specific NAD(P)(+) transhydrogenase subunit alpha [Phycisphaerales bacterium]